MAINYYPLINKVLASLKLQDRLSHFSDEKVFIKPFITVAREPGSGGAPIAKAIAEKLGFEFVDEQIIEEIARSTKKRKAVIQEIDEKSRSRIEDIVHAMLNTEYVDDAKYVSELVKVILTYAHKGHCVILGRGANFMTPFAGGLHVNITAPYKVRLKRAMDFEGLNEAQAKELLSKIEKERASFVKQYFKHDIDKKNAYDLTINTSYFRVDEARDVIIEALYRKFSRSLPYGFAIKKAVK